MNYFFAFAGPLPLVIATLDWLTKGMWDWEELDEIRKGLSWHLIVFSILAMSVILAAASAGNWWLLFGLLGIANEDFFFYLFKSKKLNRLWPPSSWCWNNWLFNSKQKYFPSS